jgi:uncharacterized protein YjbI with pentapeptide repeats
MRETNLSDAVLVDADCKNANFKFADLRGADLSGAVLTGANFEGAKVYGMTMEGAQFGDNSDTEVDISEKGDRSELIPTNRWINNQPG